MFLRRRKWLDRCSVCFINTENLGEKASKQTFRTIFCTWIESAESTHDIYVDIILIASWKIVTSFFIVSGFTIMKSKRTVDFYIR